MLFVWRLVLICMLGALSLAVSAQMPEVNLFNNENGNAVLNSPTKPTVFTLTEPKRVTLIRTYHWNRGAGAVPGTISILDAQGRTVWAWTATLMSRYYSMVKPDIVFPAGTYTLVDSDPATWAHNTKTGGAGFGLVNGCDLPPDEKGPVQAVLQEQQQAATDEKGPVRPLVYTTNDGITYYATRTYLKVGETFEVRAMAPPASEYWVMTFSVALKVTDINGVAVPGIVSSTRGPKPLHNDNGQQIGISYEYRAEKAFTGKAHFMLEYPDPKLRKIVSRAVYSFNLAIR